MQALGQAIIGRRPLSRFVQIDRLATVETGAGTTATRPIRLRHGRYAVLCGTTLPSRSDRSRSSMNAHGLPDWGGIPVAPGEVVVPLVQHIRQDREVAIA